VALVGPESGEDIIIDFGLPLEFPDVDEGEVALENGLLRFDAPFKAMVVSYSGNLGHR
jgi:hypothetical protein